MQLFSWQGPFYPTNLNNSRWLIKWLIKFLIMWKLILPFTGFSMNLWLRIGADNNAITIYKYNSVDELLSD